MTEARVIPLFPLASVLVPGLVLPLHIFEPRYRQLVSDLLDVPEDERSFGVVAIREGREVGEQGVQALFDVGTLASLREVTPYDDGRSDIVTVGTERFRIGALVDGEPYLRAEVEILGEEAGDNAADTAESVARAFGDYRGLLSDEDDEVELPDDPRVLSYLVAAAVIAELPVRQQFLEATTDTERLRQELGYLKRETALVAQVPSLPAVDLAREPFGVN